MEKFLILTSSFGGGHNSAAEAVKQELERHDSIEKEIMILDALEYISSDINDIAISIYNVTSSKYHKLYNLIYNKTNDNDEMTKLSRFAVTLFSPLLLNKIRAFDPSYIICTHPFPSIMVTHAKKKKFLDNINTSVILTDFEVHELWLGFHEYLDSIFVSTEEMKTDLIENYNVPEGKVFATGIPLKKSFNKKYTNLELENTKKELGIIGDNKILLFFAGGAMGLSDASHTKMFLKFAKGLSDHHIILITGKNDELYNAYESVIAENNIKKVSLIRFANNVPELMEISEFIVSKPGGLTTSESLAKGAAMLIVNPIPGQEESNTRYLEKNNAGIRITYDNIDEVINRIKEDKSFIQNMRKNAKRIGKPNASKDVIDIILSNKK